MSEVTILVVAAGTDYFIARVPALPGANASGRTREEAVANARIAFRAYRELLAARGVAIDAWKDIDPAALPVEDLPPSGLLPGEEIPPDEHALRDFLHQLEASRAALITLVKGLSPAELERVPTAGTWSVREALEHIMQTDLLLLAKLERWPDDPFGTLQAAHRIVFQRFSVLEASDATDHEIAGRRWTTKRVMRRLLEHEFEHYQHIRQIVDALSGDPPPT